MGAAATVTIPLTSFYELVVGKLKYESLISEMIRKNFPDLKDNILFDYTELDSDLYQEFCKMYGGMDTTEHNECGQN